MAKKTAKKAKATKKAKKTTEEAEGEKIEPTEGPTSPKAGGASGVNAARLGQPIAEGDFVLVDLLGRLTEKGTVFHVTNEERARAEGLWEERRTYAPELVKVGESGVLFDALMAELTNDKKVGDTFSVDLSPDQAFGRREAKNFATMGIREFKKRFGKEAKVGAHVQDPRTRQEGHVMRVSQGRVRIDFNHPLAGQRVTYEVTVLDKLESEEEIIRAFLQMRGRGLDPTRFELNHDKESKTLEVVVPQEYLFAQLTTFKFLFAMDLQRNVDSVDTVKFVEVFEKPSEPKPAPVPEATDRPSTEGKGTSGEEGAAGGAGDGGV
ncbi:MAG: hypothetical protein Kow0069_03960 [Promethearchaeota archaeon]